MPAPTQLKKLEAAADEADQRYGAAAKKLSAAREKSAQKLDRAVNAELAPLEARAGDIYDPDRKRSHSARAARIRSRRILGADQSRHATRPADEGRLPAASCRDSCWHSGRAVRPRLGRRRSCSTKSIPALVARCPMPSARGWRAWPPRVQVMAGDACAAGRREGRPASVDLEGRARQGQARRHPRQRARRRSPPRRNRPHAGRAEITAEARAAADRLLKAATA